MSNRRKKEQKKKKRSRAKELERQHRRQHNRKPVGVGAVDQTPNAKMILDAMRSEGVKGNYRDYVLLVGDRLIDWKGSHNIVTIDGNKPAHVSGIRLMHKRNLKNVLPEDIAAMFWHPKMGRMGAKQ